MLHPKSSPFGRTALTLLALALLIGLLAGCGKKNDNGNAAASPSASASEDAIPADTVIATYDGGQVTEGEFDKYIAFMSMMQDPQISMYMSIPQFKEQYVKQYAVYKVLAGQLSDEQKKDAQKQFDDFKSQMEEALKGDNAANLQSAMDQYKITKDEMYDVFNTVISSNEILSAKQNELKAAVKDADIKAIYDKAPADYNVDTVRHILVSTSYTDASGNQATRTDEEALKRAQEVKARQEAGGDWTALAKEYSDDPGSKDNGGLYDATEARQWVEEFKNAANTQPIGKIGDPVKTDYGYHVIMVVKREETPYDKLSQDDKDEIVSTITDPQMQTYLDDQVKKLNVQVTLPEASPEPSASASASPSASASATPSASASPSAGASPSASAGQ